MALPFETSRAFNDEVFSDVTIKFSDREIKCHKLVLCQGCDYFKALCGPDGKFVESGQKVIELKEDDPDAVEVMLRYLYNISYDTIMASFKESGKETGLALQMAIFLVGKKYMLRVLEEKGRTGVGNCITDAQTAFNETKDTAEIFSTYSFLFNHKELDDEFHSMMVQFGEKHLPDLFALKEFRQMLEEEENKDALDLAVKAVKRVYKPPQTVTVARSVRRKVECYDCGNTWYSNS